MEWRSPTGLVRTSFRQRPLSALLSIITAARTPLPKTIVVHCMQQLPCVSIPRWTDNHHQAVRLHPSKSFVEDTTIVLTSYGLQDNVQEDHLYICTECCRSPAVLMDESIRHKSQHTSVTAVRRKTPVQQSRSLPGLLKRYRVSAAENVRLPYP